MPMHIDHKPFHVKRPWLTADESGCRGEFFRSISAVAKWRDNGPRWKYFNADLVVQAILLPCALLTGLRRKDYKDGYCYASFLASRYDNHGSLIETPPDRLFLVYVRKFMGLVVFDWDFRKRSKANPNLPANFGEDFEDVLWTKPEKRTK
jgi:hypothetical protein